MKNSYYLMATQPFLLDIFEGSHTKKRPPGRFKFSLQSANFF